MLGTGSAIEFLSSLGARAVVSTLAAYASTKGGINTLVKYFAAALGQRGIRVNAVAPGVIDTGMSNFTKTEDGRAVVMGMQSLKRIGPPADVASVVAEKSHPPLDVQCCPEIEVKVIKVVKLSAAQGGRYDLGNSCRRVSAIPCCR